MSAIISDSCACAYCLLPVVGHAHMLDFLFCQRSALRPWARDLRPLAQFSHLGVVVRVTREGAHKMLNLRLGVRKN